MRRVGGAETSRYLEMMKLDLRRMDKRAVPRSVKPPCHVPIQNYALRLIQFTKQDDSQRRT